MLIQPKDTRNFKPLQNLDKYQYLSEISESRWCGPYTDEMKRSFFFFTINEAGNNEYYLEL